MKSSSPALEELEEPGMVVFLLVVLLTGILKAWNAKSAWRRQGRGFPRRRKALGRSPTHP
jgi:hypothetical protein